MTRSWFVETAFYLGERKMSARQLQVVEKEFKKAYAKVFSKIIQSVKAYEATQAEVWVVIADDQAWVAFQDVDEFVFWGQDKKCVSFPIPHDFLE